MTVRYEAFEHTADVGLHAYGPTLPELFLAAAEGMESLMVSPEQVNATVERVVTAEGHDLVSLLISWLSELITLFDCEFLLFRRFEIEQFSETRLTVRASGEAYDSRRHDLSSAIKAVTWHEAEVSGEEGNYRARVIFDI